MATTTTKSTATSTEATPNARRCRRHLFPALASFARTSTRRACESPARCSTALLYGSLIRRAGTSGARCARFDGSRKARSRPRLYRCRCRGTPAPDRRLIGAWYNATVVEMWYHLCTTAGKQQRRRAAAANNVVRVDDEDQEGENEAEVVDHGQQQLSPTENVCSKTFSTITCSPCHLEGGGGGSPSLSL